MTEHTMTKAQRRHRTDCTFAYPATIDRTQPLEPQMAGAMVAMRRVFGTCNGRDLVAIGFTDAELANAGAEARKLAYAQAPDYAANDDDAHVSDEDIAATLRAAPNKANGVRGKRA